MTPRRVTQAHALVEIARAAAQRPIETVWVGVDGCGGAGKSTFAARVAADDPRAVVVHVDDFSGPREKEWDVARFRAQVLLPLQAGRRARYQRWDWGRDAGAEWYEIARGALVVVEGVSATRAEVGAPWSMQVWVETPGGVRLRRALERDGADGMARWHDDWIPSEEAYIARERPQDRVDLIVDGTEGPPA